MDLGLKLERLLGSLVPGALFVVGIWYFHRPFLLKRFPSISAEDVGTDTKTMVFLVLAIGAGVLIQHLADHTIVVLVKDASDSEKATQWLRRLSRKIGLIFSLGLEYDPRVHAVQRYMDSRGRSERFFAMVADWASSTPAALAENSEKVIVHQHIVARLKALSEHSRAVVDESYNEVHFAAALFSAFALLLPVGCLALWTSNLANDDFASFTNITYLILIGAVWSLGVVTAYSVKRQFRDFCSRALTLALHFHHASSSEVVPVERILGPNPKVQQTMTVGELPSS